MTEEEKKALQRVTVYFKPDLLKKVKLLAVAQDKDASAIINEAVETFIKANKPILKRLAQDLNDD